MGKLKDKLYYYFAEKNWGVRREYGPYVDAHKEEHYKHPMKHRWLLIRLNWHYRVLRRKDYLLPQPVESHANNVQTKALSKKALPNAAPSDGPRLPYLDGAESEMLKRLKPIHFARALMSYDVISFDIFDTLILRPWQKPIDLFAIMGKRLDFSGFNETFAALRRRSEIEAREYAKAVDGNPEINIFQIYERLAQYTDITVENGVENEFQTELDYCFANPYMLQVFRILRAQGKKIIIASDMYFPEEYMKKLLEKNGYTGYDRLYVSCDHKACKGTGELYKIIRKDYSDVEPEKIVQVGDNLHSDINMAKKHGLSAMHYKNVHEAGNQYRVDGMTPVIGSYYAGIVNTHLHNGVKTYPFYYEYGFTYMGIYIYGMCRWLHEKAKREGVDKIIFLSRDGYIYRKVFNMLYDDVDNCYEYWSRSAAMRYSVAKRNYEEFVKRYVDYRINDSSDDGMNITVYDLLASLDITELSRCLFKFSLLPTHTVSAQNKNSLRDFLWTNKEYILEKYSKTTKYAHDTFRKAVGGSKRIALIDVGWTGHNLMNLKSVIQKDIGLDCDVKVWMAAEKNGANGADLLDGSLDAYLFNNFVNYDITNAYHNRNNSKVNTPFFELGTQPSHPSFVGFDENGEYRYDMPIVEDYHISDMFEKGILDFCRIYHSKSENDKYLRNIPGRDAYRPFSMTVRSFEFIRRNFLNVHISMNIGSNSSIQRVESIGKQFSTFSNKGKR